MSVIHVVYLLCSPVLCGCVLNDAVQYVHYSDIRRPNLVDCAFSYVPPTSLSRPPWPELPVLDPEEDGQKHQGKWVGLSLTVKVEYVDC